MTAPRKGIWSGLSPRSLVVTGWKGNISSFFRSLTHSLALSFYLSLMEGTCITVLAHTQADGKTGRQAEESFLYTRRVYTDACARQHGHTLTPD